MEKELEQRIFLEEDYNDKNEMEQHIKEDISTLRKKYPNAIVTREFYKVRNILIRTTEIHNSKTNVKQHETEREIDDWHIRQRGGR